MSVPSFNPNRPSLSRRSIIAALAGLPLAAARSNSAGAQATFSNLPPAADALNQFAPVAMPNLKFQDASGKALSLQDYQGTGLLVSIWATWCGPCVAEFPTLAAIAAPLAASRILVLPISIDFEGLKAVKPFYAAHNITTLPILLDPDGTITDTINAPGIPVSLIINPAGKLAGRIDGGANWNTPDTLSRLRRLAGSARVDQGFQPV